MATSVKSVLLVAGAALLVGACADQPYYGYGNGPDAYYSQPSYGYYDPGYSAPDYSAPGYYAPGYYAPGYYDPGYVGPSVGFGLAFGSGWDGERHWNGDQDEHEWREHHHH